MGGAASQINTVLTVILVIIGGLMTFLIMLQEGKGGGLAALGGTKAAGIEGVTNPIRRATAWMAGLFFILAVVLGWMNRPVKNDDFITDSKEAAKVEPAANQTGPDASVKKMPEFESNAAAAIKTTPATTAAVTVIPPIKAIAKDATPTEAPKDTAKPDAKTVPVTPDAPKETPKIEQAKPEPLKPEPPKVDPEKNQILKPNATEAPVDKK